MLKFSGLYLAVTCLGTLLGWLPRKLLNSVRKSELRTLRYVATEGPGGFDDAVQAFVLKHPSRYSAAFIDALKKSEPGSADEELYLSFAEELCGVPEVLAFLEELAGKHPDPEVRVSIRYILQSAILRQTDMR